MSTEIRAATPSAASDRGRRRRVMSRYRVWLVCASLAGAVAFPGCALMNSGKHWWTAKNFNWRGPDDDDEIEDKWGFVGKENRNGQTLEKEDWLDRLIWSDQARQINHNLGVN